MRRILDRYIFVEIAGTWLAVTLVLLMILLTNQFASVLGDVAKGKLPRGVAMEVIGLSVTQYLTVLIPIGLFLSVMLALGRLYRDSELPAMMACRLGPMSIYRPMLWLAVPLTLSVAWLAIDVGPKALMQVERIGAEARRAADLTSIEPGRFTVIGDDEAVVYGERITPEGGMENVFLKRQLEDNAVEVVVAERGRMRSSSDPDIRFLVLYEGRRYEGVPGTTDFRVVEFAEHGIPYRLPSLELDEPEPRERPVRELIASSEPSDQAELQWRLSVPISTMLLALLAVPLSRSQPREGRYGRLAIGLLVFIIYFNMLSAAKSWIEQGDIAPELGLWWVHGSLLALSFGLLAVQNGWHRRIFQ